jgi:quercetin dioxygenase-like cupin family protein
MVDARASAAAAFRAEGLAPIAWSADPGHRYGTHDHARHKVLYCVEGSITFTTADGDVVLHPGDRFDLPAGTRHSAIVGPGSVTCMEALRER